MIYKIEYNDPDFVGTWDTDSVPGSEMSPHQTPEEIANYINGNLHTGAVTSPINKGCKRIYEASTGKTVWPPEAAHSHGFSPSCDKSCPAFGA